MYDWQLVIPGGRIDGLAGLGPIKVGGSEFYGLG